MAMAEKAYLGHKSTRVDWAMREGKGMRMMTTRYGSLDRSELGFHNH